MIKQKISNTILLVLLFHFATAQIGGKKAFEFLNLPSSARTTALGGILITVLDDDIALADQNPAALDSLMHNQLSFNHNFNFAGISHGMFNYGRYISKWDLTTQVGIQYISYGDFTAADEIGTQSGQFDAGEMALVLGIGKKINERINVGINIIGISGNYERYSSSGLATDLAVSYNNPESRFTSTLAVKSLGFQFSAAGSEREKLPLDIQLGVSKKLNHLPFRINVTAQNLQQWGIRYDDPSQQQTEDIFGNVEEPKKFNQAVDNFFRHLVFGGEFLLGKSENLRIRLGYNHLRRRELQVSQFRSLGGFSFGFGLKIYKFRIDYGVGSYHLAGGTNHLTISTNLSEYRKKI